MRLTFIMPPSFWNGQVFTLMTFNINLTSVAPGFAEFQNYDNDLLGFGGWTSND